MNGDRFRSRYGPWAVVIGGSEGLGEAFAHALAARGLNLALAARRRPLLEATAAAVERAHGVQTRALVLDLADRDGPAELLRRTADLEVGLLVCNAALSPIGAFLDLPSRTLEQMLDLNCRSTVLLAHALGGRMVERGRGGMIIVTSLAGLQGTAQVVQYAATKAYLRVLAEGLWQELRPHGVDVLGCCAGQIRTPAFERSAPQPPSWLVVPVSEPEPVVAETLAALGRGPLIVPDWRNRVAAFITQRLLPRWLAVGLISATTNAMYPPRRRGAG